MQHHEITEAFPTPILKYFEYSHLPENLRALSRPFKELAWDIYAKGTDGAERATALRKLLEAKDATIRSLIK